MGFRKYSKSSAEERDFVRSAARVASPFLRSMSSEPKLLILCLLADGEASVSEVVEEMDIQQPAVSLFLLRLKKDGLVVARRHGRNVYYSLARPEITSLIGVLDEIFCRLGHDKGRARDDTSDSSTGALGP